MTINNYTTHGVIEFGVGQITNDNNKFPLCTTVLTNTPFPCPFLAKSHPCLFILRYFQAIGRSIINKQVLDRKGT